MRLPRFTIRLMLIAAALCATLLWGLLLPGRRAQHLARLIRNGETDLALAMLADLPDDAVGYRNVVQHVSSQADPKKVRDLRQIELQAPTLTDWLTFQRSILIGQGWGGGNCELIVTPNSVRAGQNWFHEWQAWP